MYVFVEAQVHSAAPETGGSPRGSGEAPLSHAVPPLVLERIGWCAGFSALIAISLKLANPRVNRSYAFAILHSRKGYFFRKP